VGVTALGLMAQQFSRETYRDAYRVWREAEPDLERAAGAGGNPLDERARHAAAEATNFGQTRSTFLRQLAEKQKQNYLPLQDTVLLIVADVAPAREVRPLVDAETATVQKSIATFADETDPGLQKLRQVLEREQTALASLDAAIAQREKAQATVTRSENASEQARIKVFSAYQSMAGAVTESAAMVDKETAAWTNYYPALAENARGVRSSIGATSVPSTAAPAPSVSSGAPAGALLAPGITPLPLPRYTGEWVYPTVNGMFHGSEPETVDLTVHEENGRGTGTFFARFKLPAGGKVDPVVRFDFSGDFAATRNQKFSIVSSNGAEGTIELMPGNAFNLLEINFQMSPMPGKINSADLLLVKK
jgi:hypothetical protein